MTFSQALTLVSTSYRRAKLVPIYWDLDEYDCTPGTRRIMRDDAVHLHATCARGACLNLLAYRLEYEAALRVHGWPPEPRYRCLRGPDGLIHGVARGGRDISDLWGPR